LQAGTAFLRRRGLELVGHLGARDGLARKLAVATLATAGIRFAGMAAMFLVGVQLAHYLGPAGYGVYGTALALAMVIAVPAQLGLPQLVTREVSAFLEAANYGRVKGAVLWFAAVVLTGSLAVAVLASVGIVLWDLTSSKSPSNAYYIGMVMVPLLALTTLGMSILRGFQRISSGQLYDSLLRPIAFALFLFLWRMRTSHVDPETAMGLQVAAGFVILAICAWQIHRIFPREVRAAKASAHRREWVASAAPMAGTEILRTVESQYPMLLLGFLLAPTDVGLFRVAMSMVGFIGLPGTLLNIVIMPFAAQFHAAGDRRRLQRLATTSALAMSAMVWTITLGVILFGKPFIGATFGRAFVPAWSPLVLMGLAYSINALFGPSATMLNMCGGERSLTVIQCAGLAIGVTVTVVLAPDLGLNAAAVGMIVSEAVKSFAAASIVRRRLGVEMCVCSPAMLRYVLGAWAKPSQPGK